MVQRILFIAMIGASLVLFSCGGTPVLTAQGVVRVSEVAAGVNQNYLYAMGGYRELKDKDDKTLGYQIWVIFFNDAVNLDTLDPERFFPGTDYPSGEYLLISIANTDLNSIVSQNGYTFQVDNPNKQKDVKNYFEVNMNLGSEGAAAQETYSAIGKVGTISATIHLQETKLTLFDGSFSIDFEYPDYLEGDFSVNFLE